jgi:hypothetical protein
MNDLLLNHPDLVEEYLGALEIAAEKLLALPSWSEEATIVLLHQPQGGVSIAPIQGLAGLLEPISIPGIDTYARMRFEGKGIDEALQACIDTYVVNPTQDQGKPERLEPLVTEEQAAEFVALAEKGFARDSRELLVLVKWPDQVTAFLASCEDLV